MNLILVSYDNGDNLDLFVWARNREEALDLWAAYYAWDETPSEARTFRLPNMVPPDKPRAMQWTTDVVELK